MDIKFTKFGEQISICQTHNCAKFCNKKLLKNVGPIRHCEPPHADVHNNNNNDNA